MVCVVGMAMEGIQGRGGVVDITVTGGVSNWPTKHWGQRRYCSCTRRQRRDENSTRVKIVAWAAALLLLLLLLLLLCNKPKLDAHTAAHFALNMGHTS